MNDCVFIDVTLRLLRFCTNIILFKCYVTAIIWCNEVERFPTGCTSQSALESKSRMTRTVLRNTLTVVVTPVVFASSCSLVHFGRNYCPSCDNPLRLLFCFLFDFYCTKFLAFFLFLFG